MKKIVFIFMLVTILAGIGLGLGVKTGETKWMFFTGIWMAMVTVTSSFNWLDEE